MKNSSVLSAELVVEWKRKSGALKVPIPPKHIVICPQQVFPSRFRSFWHKEIKGIMGRHVCMDPNQGVYLSSGWGIGGPALVAVCEEFYALGARNFLLIGMTGRLSSSMAEGDIMYATSALREEGTSYHYLNGVEQKTIDCPSNLYFERFNQLGFASGRFVSTDAPYRETVDKLESWTAADCDMIDMETASLYAFARYHDVSAISIGIGADSLADDQWIVPNDFKKLRGIIRNTTYQVIDLLL